MASIVKVPNNRTFDYDHIAFTFNGKHSVEDFGIYRVSKSNFYDEELTPTLQDQTAEAPGMEGLYYFNTKHKQRVFNIDIAFEGLTERKLQDMKKWLDGKTVADLWFAEAPYKVYSAKVTSIPKLQYVVFPDEINGRVYNGTGTIQFTCYHPYAHTPDYI